MLDAILVAKAQVLVEIRTHVIGVITHGGVQPKKWAAGPPWERKMAAQLTA